MDGLGTRLRRWVAGRAGVRARSATAAGLVVAAALAAAGLALVALLDDALRSVAEDAALARADEVAAALAGGRASAAALAGGSPVALVQVLGPDGAVLAASPPLQGADALVGPAAGDTTVVQGSAFDLADELLVVARTVETPAGPRTVAAAELLGPAGRTADTVRDLMLLGLPLLVLVAGAVSYAGVGRALRPVEAIRAEVAALTDRELDRRVPVPPVADEIGRLAVTMNDMLARLEQARDAQRRFVADAGHELRSPLATVVAGLELLEGHDAREAQLLAGMRADAARLERLVEDLLLLARADERGLPVRSAEVDLDALVYAEQVRLRGTPTAVEVDVTPVRVCGDGAQLARALRNLVDNAVRHAAGRVRLRLAPDGDGALLEVGDDGPGIPEAERQRVFERFVRLSTGGAGLGLAIAAEIVRLHGGRIEAAGSEWGGALLRVRLPAQPPASR